MNDLLFFNIDDGFPEALIRSLRLTLLKEEDYTALKHAQNLADFKQALEETDYQSVLINEPSPIEVSRLKMILKKKLADDIAFIQAQAVQPLYEFLEMMRQDYMIDNVIYIIEGLKEKQNLEDLLKKANPIGEFPELKTIRMVEGDDYADLYQTVLIDLPIGNYFHKFLEGILVNDANKDASAIPAIMREYKPAKIQHLIKKIWMNEFHYFCTNTLTGASKEVMDDLLKFESDCMTMQVIYNSFGNKELSGEAKAREGERRKYILNLGYLYPGRDNDLTSADDLSKLKDAVKPYEEYKKMMENVPDPSNKEEFEAAPKKLGKYVI